VKELPAHLTPTLGADSMGADSMGADSMGADSLGADSLGALMVLKARPTTSPPLSSVSSCTCTTVLRTRLRPIGGVTELNNQTRTFLLGAFSWHKASSMPLS
jgi:hypothetical protein